MSKIQNDIEKAMQSIAKDWKKKKRQADKFGHVKFKKSDFEDSYRVYQHEQIQEVLPEAIGKATGGFQYSAVSRQIYYVVRSFLSSEIDELDSAYFQKVLKDFLEENPEYQTHVIWDARGNLKEPHTRLVIPMGGLGVERYTKQWVSSFEVFGRHKENKLIDTFGAANRYSAVLFLEKEGFNELLQSAGILEKYDLAIMSTKGVPNKAACDLIEQLDAKGVRIFALHDFDLAGFTIIKTLREGVRLSNGTKNVIELGLRYEDIEGLQSEHVTYNRTKNPRYYLRTFCNATKEEAEFLVAGSRGNSWFGKRVELNAFTSDKFIVWLERKLQAHGVTKVVPDKEILIKAYQRAVFNQKLNQEAILLQKQFENEPIEVPANLESLVREKTTGKVSWDESIWEMAKEIEGEANEE